MHVLSGFGGTSFQVTREGSTIRVADADHRDCRCPGDAGYEIGLGADRITIQGFNREQGSVDYALVLTPDRCTIEDSGAAGYRRGVSDGPKITEVQFDSPLKPEQYETVGLAIASSLIGVPLVFPQG